MSSPLTKNFVSLCKLNICTKKGAFFFFQLGPFRKWRNWTWGATKMVSTPPYSPIGQSDLGLLGIIWQLTSIEVASPTRFLNFNPGPEQWAPKVGGSAPPEVKKFQKFFFEFLTFFFAGTSLGMFWFTEKNICAFSFQVFHPKIWFFLNMVIFDRGSRKKLNA